MIPEPLHPAVVHFPIVLMIVLPFLAIASIVAIRRGQNVSRAWLPVFFVAFVLAGSAWAAVQTGEREEEAVEEVVTRSAIHDHEEAAEVFLPLTFVVLAIVGGGLLGGAAGKVARPLGAVAAVVLVGFGYAVGESGGELVYEYGAANAYLADSGSLPNRNDDADEARNSEEREHERESREESRH